MRIVVPSVIKVPTSSGGEKVLQMNIKPAAEEVHTLSSNSGNNGSSSNSSSSSSSATTTSIPAVNYVYEAPASSYQDLSGIIEELYARKLEMARSALEKAYNASVLNIDATMSGIAPLYEDARNRTAASSELEKRNFAEWANAKGLNNGASAQNELARSVTLQGNLGTLNKSEAADYAELERQRVKAKNDYEYAMATAAAENGISLAESLYGENVRMQNALAAEAKAAAAAAQAAAELQYKQAMAQMEIEYKQAAAQAELEFKQAQAAEEAKSAKAQSILEWQYKFDQLEKGTGTSAASSTTKAASTSSAAKSTSVTSSTTKAVSTGSSSSKSSSSSSSKSSASLFEDMYASGNPYTYLTTNHSKYGISSSAAATMSKVYDEYLAWVNGSSGTLSSSSGSYTSSEYSNYVTILDKLAVNSSKSGEDPISYVRRLEGVMGDDFYTKLMGQTLYERFLGEVGSYYKAYSAMTASGNASKWLKDNSSKYSSDIVTWLSGKV